jgi:hypothetical protein
VKSFLRATAAVVTGVLLSSVILASGDLASAQAPAAPQGHAPGPDLPTLLHLRPDQLAAYHAVEAAGHDSPALLAQMRAKAQRLPSETFPQRLDFQAEVLNLQVARAHRVIEAQRKFYALLTPAQQHTLDQVTAPHLQQAPAPH